jgi:hypothetical protein
MARDFGISSDEIIKESLKSFAEKKLRETGTSFFELCRKYNVSSVAEMEEQYRNGTLEESFSREDFERLDHLEFMKDELEKALGELC